MTDPKTKVTQLLQQAHKVGPQYPQGWKVTRLDDVQPKIGSDYLLKHLIDRRSLVLVYGESGSGKTFFSVDLALHVATGSPWRGRRMSQGLVMYLAVENPGSVRNRVYAWREHHKPEPGAPFVIVDAPMDLRDPKVEQAIVDGYQLALREHHAEPGVIVIDTLSRAMPGADENSPEDMTALIGACDRIRSETGAAIVMVHHAGKDLARGARGHSSLKAAVDVEVEVRDKVARVTKNRDGESGVEFPFALELVNLGADQDGDEVVTCVVVDQPEQSRPRKLAQPSGGNQRAVYDAIRELAEERGELSLGTSAIPKGVRIVKIEDVIERASPKVAADPKRKRGRIMEAINGMVSKDVVGLHDPYVWIWR